MVNKVPSLMTFEGGEGVGKSTQIQKVATFLEAHHFSVLVTFEPGETEYGKEIRHLILQPRSTENLCALSELLLYAADRAQHVETVIRPALAAGKIVLCDRYTDSTVAYQGYARQLDLALIATLNTIATGGLSPDLTFWFDVSPAIGLQRIGKRASLDRLEGESLAFHERIHHGYCFLAECYPERIVRIDANENENQVFKQIQAILAHILPSLKTNRQAKLANEL